MKRMNLQMFADPAPTPDPTPAPAPANPPAAPEIDYEKIANLVAGKQAATEDSILRGYFKQQGLSKEEMEQAITAFKQQKAASQPDVNAIQSQLTQAQALARQAQIESAATMAAVGLGIDAKTIPYVLKLADLSQVMGQDGKINEETLKSALNKVLEDVPALKPQTAGTAGFQQVGTGGNPYPQNASPSSTGVAQPQVPTKRWNRFNN